MPIWIWKLLKELWEQKTFISKGNFQLLFFMLLACFLLSALVFFSDYRDSDQLYLRRVLQTDTASVRDFILRKYSELTIAFRQTEREKPDKRDKSEKLKQEFW